MKRIIILLGFVLLGKVLFAQGTINYTYDNLGRLTQVMYPDSSVIDYSYHNNGNRATKRVQDPCATKPRPHITASGPLMLCIGDSVVLAVAPGVKYVWSNGDTVYNHVTAQIAGNYFVMRLDTFSVNGDTIQCYQKSDTVHVIVSPSPYVSVISGSSSVPLYSGIALTDSVTGGTWSSSNPAVAAVNSSGLVAGVALGIANISYVVTYSCGTADTFKTITVTAPLNPNIYTFAGNGVAGYSGDGGVANVGMLAYPTGIALDGDGNLFIADFNNNRVRKVNVSGMITTVAGNGVAGFSGDDGPATSAQLNGPYGVMVDGLGNLYIADDINFRLRKVSPTGIITTIAGNGTSGFSGDGGPAISGMLNGLNQMAIDNSGNIFIADFFNNRIRKINAGGIITTVAGDGGSGFGGDGGQATTAQIFHPAGVAIDATGNLYIADGQNNRIRMVTTSGIISTLAGNGTPGFSGDGGPATSAVINNPSSLRIDGLGNIYFTDQNNNRVRRINVAGIITTVAGNGTAGYSGDGGPANLAELYNPYDIAIDNLGNMFVADEHNSVIRIVGVLNYTPAFINGASQNLDICGSLGIGLDPLLAFSDIDTGQIETLSMSTGPVHGSLSGFGTAYTSTGGTIVPTGLTYTPTVGYSGADSFSIQVSDGIKTAITKVHVTITAVPSITLVSIPSICQGETVAALPYTDTSGSPVTYDVSWSPPAVAQGFVNPSSLAGIINTIAGNGIYGYIGDGGIATAAELNNPEGIAVDGAGNTYVTDRSNNVIRKITASGIITTIAGTGTAGFAGDGGPATSALLNYPEGIAIDKFNNLYFSDAGDSRIRKISSSGVISTIAGNGTSGYSGDGGSATSAQIYAIGVAVDGSGNVYFTDPSHHRIRKISSAGLITTVAGNGISGYSGGGGPATSASLNDPIGIAVDNLGNLFFCETSNNVIRKVDSVGIITTVAGVNYPMFLTLDRLGNIYTSDVQLRHVYKVSSAGIDTVAGSGSYFYSGDGGLATAAGIVQPEGLAVDSAGNIYIADFGDARVRKVNSNITLLLSSPITLAVPGAAIPGIYSGTLTVSNNSCTSVTYPISVTVNPVPNAGSITGPSAVCSGSTITLTDTTTGGSWSSSNPLIATVSGGVVTGVGAGMDSIRYSYTNSCGAAVAVAPIVVNPEPTITLGSMSTVCIGDTVAALSYSATTGGPGAYSITWSPLAIAHGFSNTISTPGIINTIAGNGLSGYSGDGGMATSAEIGYPIAIATDHSGNYYFADNSTSVIRKVDPAGIITTIAGAFTAGYNGDGIPATSAMINHPWGVAVDGVGNVYIADFSNNRIRKVNTAGVITTIAGNGVCGFSGDGGPATSAQLCEPQGIAVDVAGNVYLSDVINHRIRKIDTLGIITTIAGNGASGYSGDGGGATASELHNPTGLVVDPTGNIYIADEINHCIRKVDVSGIITTIAGTGICGFSGDGGPATSAQLCGPVGLSIDLSGNLYIADRANDCIRKVDALGNISRVAGIGPSFWGYSGDGGPALAGKLYAPYGVVVDNSGNILIADGGNYRVRKVGSGINPLPTSPILISIPDTAGVGTYTGSLTVSNDNCTSISHTINVTVSPLPFAGTITGPSEVCSGSTITLTDTTAGGAWSSKTPSIATVSSGIVTGVSSGLDTIRYIFTNSCGSDTASTQVTVNATPNVSTFALAASPYSCIGQNFSVTINSTSLGSGTFTVTYNLSGSNIAVGQTASLVMGPSSGSFTISGVFLTHFGSTSLTITSITGSSGCIRNLTSGNTATFTVSPLPALFNVTGGGSYCTGGTGVAIGLSGSNSGINYQLYNGPIAIGSPFTAPSGPLSFGLQTMPGVYTVIATNVTTGCSKTMTGSATISTIPLPNSYSMTGGGGYCTGGTGVAIGLANSDVGVNYQLYTGITPIGTPVAGTGSAISFGIHTVAGTYTVRGTSTITGCSSSMSSSVSVVINPLPVVTSMIGGGGYCVGDSGVLVGIAGAAVGINYQLFRDTIPIGGPVPGPGWGFYFGYQTVAGVYTVVATNPATSCSSNMSGIASVYVYSLPLVYSVLGGGSLCLGGYGVDISLSGSNTGISYQLFRNGTPVGSPIPGTGFALDFGLYTVAGTYTIVATHSVYGCVKNMSGSATVTILSPVVYSVTGGGSYCSGDTGVHVGLSNSDLGVNYQLFRSTTAIGSPVAGVGGAIDFGLQTVAGFYTVKATDTTLSCTDNMYGTAAVSVSALPATFTVTGGGAFCSGPGVHVYLNGSNSGISYQLYRDAVAIGSPLPGTGAGLDFGTQSTPGTYTVIATNTATTCVNIMSGSVMVSTVPPPTIYSVTGGGSYCSGGNGVHINLSNSDTGTSYQLCRGISMVGSPLSGTGGSLDFGLQTTAGTYKVIATVNGALCTANMSDSAIISIIAGPTSYSITGGGGYCTGGTGVHIGLSGSATGVNYQLFNGLTTVGAPLPGTGASLDFGLFTATGTYSIVATSTTTTCTNVMTGTAVITINPPPTAYSVTGGGGYCPGGSGVSIGLSNSQTGVDYQLNNGPTAIGGPVHGSGGAFSFGLQAAVGTYTVIATNSSSICTNAMTGSAIVSTYSLPTAYTVTGGGAYCSGGSGSHIGLSGSVAGVNYQLYRGITAVGSSLAGTGGALDFGLQTINGTYSVVATNTTTGCSGNMTGSATITINPVPAITSMIGGGGYCVGDSGVLVGIAGAAVGINYQLYGNGNPVGSPVPGPGYGFYFGYQTIAGTYTVVATDALTGCSSNMSGIATVLVYSLPSIYSVTGGGSYCAGGYGVHIGLSGSNTGINYRLYRDGTPVGSPLPGTGSAIDFGIYTVAGTYTIIATSAVYGCVQTMTGSASVVINPIPSISGARFTVAPDSTILVSGTPAGGTWASSMPSIVTIGSSSGVITGVSLGTTIISYTLSTGCASGHSVRVTPSGHKIGQIQDTADDKLMVMPNPSDGAFVLKGSLDISDVVNLSIFVTNMLGQTVYFDSRTIFNGIINEKIKLDRSLPSGEYLIRLQYGEKNVVFQIIVQR